VVGNVHGHADGPIREDAKRLHEDLEDQRWEEQVVECSAEISRNVLEILLKRCCPASLVAHHEHHLISWRRSQPRNHPVFKPHKDAIDQANDTNRVKQNRTVRLALFAKCVRYCEPHSGEGRGREEATGKRALLHVDVSLEREEQLLDFLARSFPKFRSRALMYCSPSLPPSPPLCAPETTLYRATHCVSSLQPNN
jgi:hypothetical protein